jgi:hypothetical protein
LHYANIAIARHCGAKLLTLKSSGLDGCRSCVRNLAAEPRAQYLILVANLSNL